MSGSQKAFYILIGLFILLSLLAVVILTLGYSNACPLAAAIENRQAFPLWCWEFWLYRYQTLIGAVATIGGGVLAYIAIQRQISAGRTGEYRQTLVDLRKLNVAVSRLHAPMYRLLNIGVVGFGLSVESDQAACSAKFEEWSRAYTDARERNSQALEMIYGLVTSQAFAAAVSAFSHATFDNINFGTLVMQRLARSLAIVNDGTGAAPFIQQIGRNEAEGTNLWFAFNEQHRTMLAAINSETASVEAELIRIAPPPVMPRPD